MKVVILAGGLGTRLAEETGLRPKPMVEIGGHPILWHLMSSYAAHDFKEFVVASGYRSEMIKEFFYNYFLRNSDFTVDLRDGSHELLQPARVDWKVSVVDTGSATMTGGRVRRLRPLLEDGTFMMTYGDGLSDIDIGALVEFHRSHGRLATITAVRPPSRFGGLVLKDEAVVEFSEKPQTGEGWINGGFFVLEPGVLDYLDNDDTIFERTPLERLAADGQLMAHRHDGFWQPMDTLREKQVLEELWSSGRAPWKVGR